jgi:KaiC/GvpD/RAD55 family RecA-like ATPase
MNKLLGSNFSFTQHTIRKSTDTFNFARRRDVSQVPRITQTAHALAVYLVTIATARVKQ